MHLVDRDRLVGGLPVARLGTKGIVRPIVLHQPFHDRGGGGRQFLAEADRIGLQRQDLAMPADHLVFVDLATVEAGNEDLEQPGIDALAHDMAPPVPGVEIADHRDAAALGAQTAKATPFTPSISVGCAPSFS